MTQPTITSVSPSQWTINSSDKIITVNGTDFLLSSVVSLDGTPLTTTYVGPTQVTAVIPAALMLAVHTYDLTVSGIAPSAYGVVTFTFNSRGGSATDSGYNTDYIHYEEGYDPGWSIWDAEIDAGSSLTWDKWVGNSANYWLYKDSVIVKSGNEWGNVSNLPAFDQIKITGENFSAASVWFHVHGVAQVISISDPVDFDIYTPGKIYTYGVVFP
jgi:hypothetical protein